MRNDIIDKNYGDLITLPKAQKNTRDRFLDDELKVLWANADDPTVRIILILAYTGFRIGELLSLKKDNVYLNGSISYIIGGFKTEAGTNRYVAICDPILDFVKEAYNSSGCYLFPNSAGNQYDVGNWRKNRYYPTLDRLGIQRREIHCLRHTFASMMVKAGADPKSITQLMGHTKFSTTLEIYVHTDLNQLHDAVNKLPYPW